MTRAKIVREIDKALKNGVPEKELRKLGDKLMLLTKADRKARNVKPAEREEIRQPVVKRHPLIKEDIEELLKRYSLPEIAMMRGVPVDTVMYWQRKWGLQAGKPGPRRRVEND